MVDKLRLRAYNVGFGDAFLIRIPEKNPANNTTKFLHILIDVGSRKGGKKKEIYKEVVDDVLKELNGEPLDLYILTHEHTDHSQGLFYAEDQVYTNDLEELMNKLRTRFVWLTASADENYYEKFSDAKRELIKNFLNQREKILNETNIYLTVLEKNEETIPPELKTLWEINELASREDCIDYLRKLSKKENTCYVYRGCDFQKYNPFVETQIEIWAPEEDTTIYYGHFKPLSMSLGITTRKRKRSRKKKHTLSNIVPPSGVDAGAFYNLVKMREMIYENLLQLDKAENNTSIVFCIEWRGYRLLFTGDAEERSWKEMNKLPKEKKVLKPVHFLKISHHGSVNGTPEPEILDEFFPLNPVDGKPRIALVSSLEGAYHGTVPDPTTLSKIKERCEYLHILHEETRKTGEFLDIEFPSEDSDELIGNKRTKEVHKNNCRFVSRMKEENKQLFQNIDEAIAEGFNGCGNCLPELNKR